MGSGVGRVSIWLYEHLGWPKPPVRAVITDTPIIRGDCLIQNTKARNPDGSERKKIIAQLKHGAVVKLEADGTTDYLSVVSEFGCIGTLSPEDTMQVLEDLTDATGISLYIDSGGGGDQLNPNGRLWVRYKAKGRPSSYTRDL
jgi:hypothetical protein